MLIISILNCFLGCIHDPQSKYSAFIWEEFLLMSNFKCRLNQRFWRSKKDAQVIQIDFSIATRSPPPYF